MLKRYYVNLVVASIVLLCSVVALPQSKRKSSRPQRVMLKAVGTYYSSAMGSAFGEVCLKIKGKITCFTRDPGTQLYNLGTNRGWQVGAEWRVTYTDESQHEMGLVLGSATFTGRILSQEGNNEQRGNKSIKAVLTQQLIRDRQIRRECLAEESNPTEIISVEVEDLNGDGRPEYFIMGTHFCTSASDRANAWYYRKTSSGYEMLLFIPRMELVTKLKSMTNGYYDLKVTQKAGRDTFADSIYKFNGNHYQEARK